AQYAQAELLGYTLDGDDLYRQGQVYEWLGQPQNALDQYEMSLRSAPSDPLAVRRRVIDLRMSAVLTTRPELHDRLDALLEDAPARPEILQWALEKKIELVIADHRFDEGERVLAIYQPILAETRYALFSEYLGGLLQYKGGKYDEAELTLRNLRSKLESRDDVHARSGWLLGRVILQDDGPQRPLEATLFFRDVLDSHAVGEYVLASRLGMADALTALQRFDEALDHYRAVLDGLNAGKPTALVDRNVVRSSLAVNSRRLYEDQKYEPALEYLQLASDLTDLDDVRNRALHLSDLAMLKDFLGRRYRDQSRVAAQAGDVDDTKSLNKRSTELFLSAVEDYLELARVKTADEAVVAESLWQAAAMYDAAGHRREAIELLRDFLTGHPASEQIPVALLRIGQAYQATGEFVLAVEYYQRCIREHPRTTAAYDSYIPLAECLVILGPDYAEQAEEALLYILAEPPDQPHRFTPESYVYHEATFKLGELYSRDGRFEDAIQWFDEALQRYPEDPRSPRATFLLAHAYRRSGLDLDRVTEELASALQRDELYREKQIRLRRAEELFGEVIDRLTGYPPQSLTPLQGLQFKLSYAYRADCAFDLGEFERALPLYQEVVRVFQDDPIALPAYVQIISSYESMGRLDEVGPAVQRAQWLVGKIDSQKYESQLVRNKPEDWLRLFAWIDETGNDN
ncbi:MAG: tetratricopeptide repeat protein, partial [Planctomycetes bacterium]|nr:tetratricopeptide repeat protein [Planctomycetota bacterium]